MFPLLTTRVQRSTSRLHEGAELLRRAGDDVEADLVILAR